MKTDPESPKARHSAGRRLARDTDDERGAALVEFAIVALLLVTLALGTFEMGMAWSDSQLVTQAARTGARSVTQLGINGQADSFTVESIEAALGDQGTNVTRIVIFDASAADGAMPAACSAASSPGVSGACSIYDGSDFGTYATWVDGSWPPSTRNNDFDAGDYVGVTVEISRPYLTGFFGGSTLTITDTAVMRIEPEAGD